LLHLTNESLPWLISGMAQEPGWEHQQLPRDPVSKLEESTLSCKAAAKYFRIWYGDGKWKRSQISLGDWAGRAGRRRRSDLGGDCQPQRMLQNEDPDGCLLSSGTANPPPLPRR